MFALRVFGLVKI